jgi:hypothetical protein
VELFEVPVAQKTQPAAAPGQIASPNEVPIVHVPAEITQPTNDQATLQFSTAVAEQPDDASSLQVLGAADGAPEFAAHAEADTSQFDNSSTPGSAATPQRAELAEASTSLSSANATSQPLTTQVLTALAQRLSSVVGQTADSLTLRLDPPELGEVEVQFQRLDDGITIRVTAKESVTMEMLMSRGAEIEKLLRSQNPEVQRIELHHPDSPGEFGFGQGAGQFSRGHGGSPSGDLLADVDPLLTKPDEPLMHNGQRRMNITSGSRVRVRA